MAPGKFQERGFATLTDSELVDRLRALADQPELLPDMVAFGDRMLDEQIGRTQAIEAKAGTALGYGTAILAFLVVATPVPQIDSGLDRTMIGVVGVLAFIAVLCSFLALRVRRWEWFTAHAWVPEAPRLAGLEHLRRHYLQWSYTILRSVERENTGKAKALAVAQHFLALAALLLLLRVLVSALAPLR